MCREYLGRLGLTPGFNGCLALMTGARATNHSEVCRARIEGALAKCGDYDQTKFEQSEAKKKNKKVHFEKCSVPESSSGSNSPRGVPAAKESNHRQRCVVIEKNAPRGRTHQHGSAVYVGILDH